MVQHATLGDLFSAGMGAASPFLQKSTAQMKEKNDLNIKNESAKFVINMQNFVRDTAFNGDFNDYLEKLYKFTDEKYTEMKAVNTSAYYQRAMEQMHTQSKDVVHDYALVKQDAWRMQQANLSLASDLEGFAGSGLDATVIAERSNERIALHKMDFELNPEDEAKIRQRQYITVAGSVMSKVQHTGELDKALENFNKDFNGFMKHSAPVYDKAGRQTGTAEQAWSFSGKTEWDKALIEQERNRIHKQNMESALIDDARYRNLKEESIRTGNTTLSEQADRIAQPYRIGVINTLLKGNKDKVTEYSDSDKDRILGLFMPYDSKGVSLKGASKEQIKAIIDNYGEELMKAYFNKETTFENARELLAVLPGRLYAQVAAEFGGEYPGGPDQFYKDHADYFLNMEKALMEVAQSDDLRAMIPQWMKVFKRKIENNQQLQKKLNKDYANRLELVDKYFINEALKYLTSVRWQTIKDEELMNGLDEIIGRITSNELQLIGQASTKNPYEGQNTKTRESELAKRLAATEKSPGVVSTYRGLKNPVYTPGPDSDPEMYERGLRVDDTEAARWVARSHLPQNTSEQEVQNMMTHLRALDEIDVNRDEKNPAAIFQYGETGLFYRVKADPNNKNQIIIQSQNTATKNEKALQEDKWVNRKVNRNWVEEGTFKEEREARDPLPDMLRREAINAIAIEFDPVAKENLIKHFHKEGKITAQEAELLRKGKLK